MSGSPHKEADWATERTRDHRTEHLGPEGSQASGCWDLKPGNRIGYPHFLEFLHLHPPGSLKGSLFWPVEDTAAPSAGDPESCLGYYSLQPQKAGNTASN